MRARRTKDGFTVMAVAGTDVVLLGFNLPKAKANPVMGFAVSRTDHQRGDTTWMRGFKRFTSTDPGTPKGDSLSTRDHPVQSFQWADYTGDTGRKNTDRVVALRTAKPLVESAAVSVESRPVTCRRVWLNRGAAASPAKPGSRTGRWTRLERLHSRGCRAGCLRCVLGPRQQMARASRAV
jgi:hypothetical protein